MAGDGEIKVHEATYHKVIGMLTAFGYDWVPGNLAGGLALQDAGKQAVRVDVGYFMTGTTRDGMSGGTRASLVGADFPPGGLLEMDRHYNGGAREIK